MPETAQKPHFIHNYKIGKPKLDVNKMDKDELQAQLKWFVDNAPVQTLKDLVTICFKRIE